MKRRVSDTRRPLNVSPTVGWLLLILAGSAFLRLWQIDHAFHFMGDEGTQTLAEWRLIHGHLPLLGPSLSIGAMHLGPLFYYLAAGPLALAAGSPVGPTVMVAIFGIATVLLLYLYLRPTVGEPAALGSAAVMGASFLMVEYSRRPWNPTLTPFFTLALLWMLVAWKRGSPAWALGVSASLACLLQLQPVNVFCVPLIVLFVLIARPKWPPAHITAGAIIVFLAISSPLIIYDATHRLSNTHAWLAALTGAKSTAPARQAPSLRLLFVLFYRAYGVPIVAVAALVAVLALLALVYIGLGGRPATRSRWELGLALLLLIIAAAGFQLYHKEVFEQYLVCLFVVPFIALGALLDLLWQRERVGKLIAMVLVVGLVAWGVRNDWRYTVQTPEVTVADASVVNADLQQDDTYGHVLRLDRTILQWAHGQRFYLTMASYLNTNAGYSYVLRLKGHVPLAPASHSPAPTYLLVEPASWPRADWPPFARHLAARADRSDHIGIVRLYQIR